MVAVAAPFAVGAEVADGFPDRPKERVIGVRLKTPLVGEGEHLVVDAGGIADAQDIDAAVDKFFRDPVDGHVALGTDQHLILPSKRLVDGFDKGRGLAGARRTVDDGHILGAQDLVDSIFLGVVQIGEVEWGKGEGLRLHGRGIEEVAERAQAAFGPDDAVEGLEHRAIGGLIEEELDAEVLGSLEVDERGVVGEGDDHAVAINVAHRGGEGEIGNSRIPRQASWTCLARKEGHWPAEFEIMLNIVVIALTEHLNHQLVQ